MQISNWTKICKCDKAVFLNCFIAKNINVVFVRERLKVSTNSHNSSNKGCLKIPQEFLSYVTALLCVSNNIDNSIDAK